MIARLLSWPPSVFPDASRDLPILTRGLDAFLMPSLADSGGGGGGHNSNASTHNDHDKHHRKPSKFGPLNAKQDYQSTAGLIILLGFCKPLEISNGLSYSSRRWLSVRTSNAVTTA